jgi:hypothetical protein
MGHTRTVITLLTISLLLFMAVSIAQVTTDRQSGVPRLIRFSGALEKSDHAGMTGITFSLYEQQSGGAALWIESQSAQVDADGKFTVWLGATHADGVPLDLFATGQAQWLGIQAEGQSEQERVLLASVPYAAKAGDAETLGGKPLSAFLLAEPTSDGSPSPTQRTAALAIPILSSGSGSTPAVTGVPNYLPKFVDTSNFGNSIIADNNGRVGIGTPNPETLLDIVGDTSQMLKIGSVPWSLRFGSLQSGTQFIGIAVKKAAADNNYIATSANIASVNHTVMEFNYDGSWRIKQQAHQPDATILNLGTTLSLTPAGNFGIGVVSPAQKMELAGSLKINGTGNGIIFPDGTMQNTAIGPSGITNLLAGTGVVVSGGSSPTIGLNTSYTDTRYAGLAASNTFITSQLFNGPVTVNGPLSSISQTVSGGVSVAGTVSAASIQGHSVASVPGGIAVSAIADAEDGTGINIVENGVSGATTGIHATVMSAAGTAGVFDNLASGSGTILLGRVKIGDYWVKRFRVDGSGRVYANNGYATGGADFAESFAVKGTRSEYEPGDVLVIDTTAGRRLTRTSQPYSPLVAGIYSTHPGVMASPYGMDDENLKKEIPLAVVGVVPCKVSAENGPIQIGDLLATASQPGYAMKATDRSRMLGAVVGKALQPLASGNGVIEVLVSLQ